MGLTGDRPGEESLARAGRPNQQDAARQPRAEALVPVGRLEGVDDLGELGLRLVLARDVGKRDVRLLGVVEASPASTEPEDPLLVPLHLAAHVDDHADDQRDRQDPDDQVEQERPAADVLGDDRDILRLEERQERWIAVRRLDRRERGIGLGCGLCSSRRRRRGGRRRPIGTRRRARLWPLDRVPQRAVDDLPIERDLVDVGELCLAEERRIRQLDGAARPRPEQHEGVPDEQHEEDPPRDPTRQATPWRRRCGWSARPRGRRPLWRWQGHIGTIGTDGEKGRGAPVTNSGTRGDG